MLYILICILISQCTLIKRGFESFFRTQIYILIRILKPDFFIVRFGRMGGGAQTFQHDRSDTASIQSSFIYWDFKGQNHTLALSLARPRVLLIIVWRYSGLLCFFAAPLFSGSGGVGFRILSFVVKLVIWLQ